QAAMVSLCALPACQNDELGSLSPAASRNSNNTAVLNPPPPDDLIPNGGVIIPPSSVIKHEYPQVTSWLVTWNNPLPDYRYSLAGIFSTVDGSFHSVHSLNQSNKSSWANTAKADMYLFPGNVEALKNASYLLHGASAPATQFKPSSLTLVEFINALQSKQGFFQQQFENSPDEATPIQPYNYDGEADYYDSGDIYLFKTGRTPAVYGAIRIVDATNVWTGTVPRTIQIVVQKSNAI
ncbi:hypothetical protein ACFPQ1_25625, partial [Rhodocytophaga aerolata]